MRITLKQLQVFVKTAQANSLTRGAEACYITQAAASMSLLQLEQHLGAPLFDRIGKRLQLNANGHTLLPKAINLLDQAHECESLLSSDSLPLKGTLNIAASTTIANYVLPIYLAEFKKNHPDVAFNLVIGNTEEIVNQVKTLQCDIGFIEGVCQESVINQAIWKDDSLAIICRRNHPLSKKKTVKKKDLLAYSWVVREPGSGTREVFERATTLHQELSVDITLNSSSAILNYVANSNCLAYLSHTILNSKINPKEICQLQVDGLTLKRHFYQLTHQDKYQSQLCSNFLACVSPT